VQCLVQDLGADVNLALENEATALHIATQNGHLATVQYLVRERGVDVNKARDDGATPLFIAACNSYLAMVRCLVKELGADVNKSMHDGATHLMASARYNYEGVVAFLIKYGANTQSSAYSLRTAADISRDYTGPSEQTQYLEARTHCANTGCDGAGVKKCAGCLKVYYCAR
jgi:ankyrin repeat protein